MLRLQLELGSRAQTTDQRAWEAYTAAGPNPSEASEVWIFRTEDDHPARGADARPPVAYADPAEDERAWRASIAELAGDDDYRAAVFLRVASIRAADDAAARSLESPYRLGVERAYLIRVASLNPHLSAEALRDARLVSVCDELATAVVLDEPETVPADGVMDVLISPIVAGPGWLELDVALGPEIIAATSVGWVAERAAAADEGTPASSPEPLEPPFAPPDPIAEAAIRAYAVAEDAGMAPALRIRLLAELRAMAPDEPRLAEAEGLARYDAAEYDVARAGLAALPLDALGPRGRATLVAATLRGGQVPEPIERVRMADLWRPEAAELVLEASAALPAAEQVRLAEFVAANLLSEERASDWYATVAERELPPDVRARLLERWADIDADRAASARGKMPPGGMR